MQPKKIRKAVIAAAGFGTRFLPQTKAMPKEMLPLVDKPVIQYVVEELVSVGVEDIVIVTGYHKRSVEDHFDHMSAELRTNLKNSGKLELLEETKKISELANFIYVRQKGPYGNGTPVLNVEHVIGDEPFIYTWSDDFFVANPPRFQQMIDTYNEFGCSVLSTMKAQTDEDYDRYGFAAGEVIRDGLVDVKAIVEKPGKENSPSDLASVSGYLFSPDVFPYFKNAQSELTEGEELYSNNALKLMLADNKRIVAKEVQDGKYYDSGNKLEYLKTVVDFALRHKELNGDFRAYLEDILKT